MGDKIILEMDSGETLETKAMKEWSRLYDRQTRGNNRRDNRSISNSRSRSGSRVSTNRDRIRCFEC